MIKKSHLEGQMPETKVIETTVLSRLNDAVVLLLVIDSIVQAYNNDYSLATYRLVSAMFIRSVK